MADVGMSRCRIVKTNYDVFYTRLKVVCAICKKILSETALIGVWKSIYNFPSIVGENIPEYTRY